MMTRHPLRTALAALLILLVAFALALTWIAATSDGLRFAAWVVQKAAGPGLEIEATEGRLIGPLRIGRLVHGSSERRIVVEDLALTWRPARLLNRFLQIDSLHIGRLLVSTQTGENVPTDLTLPLAVQVDELRIDQARFGELAGNAPDAGMEVSGIAGRLASDGQQHRLETLSFATSRLAAEASVSLGGQPPFALSATARLTGEEFGRPITVALEASGSLTDLTLGAHSHSDALNVQGEASLAPFAVQPLVRGTLTVTGLDPATWFEGAPHARLEIEAEATPAAGSAHDMAGEISVVNSAPGRLDEERIPLRRLHAQFRQANERLLLPAFTATLSGGEVTGSGQWADGELTADAELSRVDAAAWHQLLKTTRLSGKLTTRLSAASQSVDADLHDPRFGLQLDATHSTGSVRVDHARLVARGGNMDVSGRFVPDGDYDLHGRLQSFDPAFFADVPSGRLNAVLDARGQLGAKPTMDLHFVLRDSVLAGKPLAGQGDVVLQPDRLQQADLTLLAGDNRVEAHGKLGLPGDLLTLRVDAPRLEQLGLGGAVAGTVTLSGRLRTPGAEWALRAPRFVLPGRADLRDLVSQGRWDPDGAIRAQLSARRLALGESTPGIADLSLRVDGQQSRHRVELAARIEGEHAVQATGSGGLGADRVWSGDVETLTWRGPNAFRLVGRTHLEVGLDQVVLRQATFAGDEWQATLNALRWTPDRLQSSGRFGGLPARLVLPLAAPPSSLYVGGDWSIDFSERADGSVNVFRERGDLAFKVGDEMLFLGLERLQFTTKFNGRQAELSVNASGTRAGTLDGRLTAPLQPAEGHWTLARNAPWQGGLHLDVPSIAWLSSLAGENVRLGGRLQADMRLAGTAAAPVTTGQASGSELQLRLLDYGLDLGGGTLQLDMTPETVRLQRLELVSVATQRPHGGRLDFKGLTAQPGRLTAEGEIVRGSGDSRFDLRAEHLAVSQLPDRWVMMSGSGGARFTQGRLAISGELRADAAYVELATVGQPSMSADVVVLGNREKPRPIPRIGMDLKVDLGDSFYFQGAGIQSRLAGAVRIAADSRDQLHGIGSVHTVGGTFDAYGRALTIERGILNFNGLVTEPGLNVRAVRKNLPVEAGVEVTGTLSDPKVWLVSSPEVPDAEKLSWMVLGRAPEKTLSGQDADLLLSAAMALRSGNQGRAPLQSLMQGLGLEELSITSGTLEAQSRFPTSSVAGTFAQGSSAIVTEQIATVGKRIGTNTVLSYERSLVSAENIVKLSVELTQGLSLIGRVGADTTVGLLYTFAFGGATPGR